MAIYDLETDIEYSDGSVRRVPVRISAGSREEAVKRIQNGEGDILPIAPGAARPAQSAQPELYAEPPRSAEQLGGETVYNPTPAPPQRGPGFVEQALRGAGRAALQGGKQVALPALGSMAAEYGGAFIPGMRAVPPAIRGAAGSVAGTAANMALGIEKPSLEQLILSAATPAAARGVGSAAVRNFPGARGAYAADFVEQAQDLPSIIRRGIEGNADELFREAYAANPSLTIPLTQSRAANIVRTERLLDPVPGLKHGTERTAQGLVGISDTGEVSLEQLDKIRQAIGAKISSTTDTVEKGQYKHLYGAILNDIEAAAASGEKGASSLLAGIASARRQFAADDLGELVNGATSRPRPTDGLQTLNVGKILQEIERPHKANELLAQFLEQNPGEKKEIVALLTDMNRRNVKLIPPAGTITGAGRNTMLFGATAGGLSLAGVNPQTAAAIAGIVPLAVQGVSRALLTKPGRALIRQAYAQSGVINPLQITLQLAGQGARQQLGDTPLSTARDVGTSVLNYGAQKE